MKHLLTFVLGAVLVVATAFTGPIDLSQGYNVGDYVADFKLRNVDGKEVSLASYPEAKGIILVFTCNTCPYAKLYEERIMTLHKQYASKGYPVVAINPNDPAQQPGDSMNEMKKRAREKDYGFAYLQDDTGNVAKTFGATRTPQLYLLNKESKGYKVEYIGAIDNNHKDASAADQKYVEDAIQQLMHGKKPKTTTTKAVGCTIKWKQS